MSEDNNTMRLWNQVCETDPEITKHVSQRGGFTAICAQAQRKRATELWGPYGSTWGFQEPKIGYVMETINENDSTLEVIKEAWFEGYFFYPEGQFFISVDIKYRAGDDVRKKLLTDATTKALSFLGFNSDVFEGRFDDNKYVEQMSKAAKTRQVIGEMKKVEADKDKWNKFRDKALTMGKQVGDANLKKIEEYVKAVESGQEAEEVF